MIIALPSHGFFLCSPICSHKVGLPAKEASGEPQPLHLEFSHLAQGGPGI